VGARNKHEKQDGSNDVFLDIRTAEANVSFEFFVFSRFLLLFSLYLGVSTGWIELRGYRPIES
jgi:hypothetical protein